MGLYKRNPNTATSCAEYSTEPFGDLFDFFPAFLNSYPVPLIIQDLRLAGAGFCAVMLDSRDYAFEAATASQNSAPNTFVTYPANCWSIGVFPPALPFQLLGFTIATFCHLIDLQEDP